MQRERARHGYAHTGKRNGRTNGKANGARPAAIDTHVLHERAGQVTTAAHGIARIADAVFDGAEAQLRSLDDAVTGVNQMAASLKRDGVAGRIGRPSSTEELVSSVNELAASIEQVSANTASLAASVTETAAVGAGDDARRSRR